MSEDEEGTIPTKSQQLKEFADTVTETGIQRLSLLGQLKQALISLERYIDSDDVQIPKFALSKAKGIVFLSLIKCGFLFEGCIGVGFIMVKCNNTEWSGPSSIFCGGLSIGFLAGATKIDYIMILPNKQAVKSFMSSGQLRIGGDVSISLGHIGRNINANIGGGDIGPISVIYSYSHSKGLYGGISLHGKILKVRHKCNREFYGFSVNNEAILCGDIQIPNNNNYDKIVFILKSYCHDPNDDPNEDDRTRTPTMKYKITSIDHTDEQNEEEKEKKKCVEECQCKLCQKNNISWNFHETNPFKNEKKTPKKQNKLRRIKIKTIGKNKNMTVNRLEIKPKISQKTAKTIISKETFLEPTPPPLVVDDGKYKYIDNKIEIIGDTVKIKQVHDPWKQDTEQTETKDAENDMVNLDPYALSIRPWDSLIEQNVNKTLDENKDNTNKFKKVINNVKKQQLNDKKDTFIIAMDEKEKEEKKEHKKYVKPERSDQHYSDYDISSYSLDKYDEHGYRINVFKLLFQIDDISYQTQIKIAGKLVSKQYIVNWPNKRDCKAVIIVTCKTYSSYSVHDPYDDNLNDYELRLICYDQRDDDLIVYDIIINFTNIKQIVNAINGAFIVSPHKPWCVLESIFSQYKKKMYESMIDISKTYNNENILKYGDLIRANFGSLCQYGIYVGEGEIVCFRRRFPNNGSSAFKKYRLFLMIFNGKASKKIRMKYMTLNEFIFDCSRIEVIYYPLPAISQMVMVKRALIATDNKIKNCIFEYSRIIQSKRTLTTKDIIEDSVLSVIDGITSTVNTITDAVSPVAK